jgi:hypothetical protein
MAAMGPRLACGISAAIWPRRAYGFHHAGNDAANGAAKGFDWVNMLVAGSARF